MNILAFDTATSRCSVALFTGRELLQRVLDTPRQSTMEILDMARELVRHQELSFRDLDLIAVDVGPGSFTGLRVGIGIAQGLAYTSEVPMVGIDSLMALSSHYPEQTVVAALDARMRQVYWGVYHGLTAIMPPHVDHPQQLGSSLASISLSAPLVGVGNGWISYPKDMPRQLKGISLEIRSELYPEAWQVAQLAASTPSTEYLSPLHIRAIYVRNQVAEKIRLEDRRN